MPFRIPLASLMLAATAALTACSQAPAPEREAAGPVASTAAGATELASTQTSPDASAKGDCDLLTAAELNKAFAGKLSVLRASGRGSRGGGCTFSLAEVEEGQLIVQVGGLADFNQRKQSYSRQSAVDMETLSLGSEAHLFNGAQIIALKDEERSISMGLVLISFGQPAPLSDEEVREGLIELTRMALERM